MGNDGTLQQPQSMNALIPVEAFVRPRRVNTSWNQRPRVQWDDRGILEAEHPLNPENISPFLSPAVSCKGHQRSKTYRHKCK